jgi:hypothetical protein
MIQQPTRSFFYHLPRKQYNNSIHVCALPPLMLFVLQNAVALGCDLRVVKGVMLVGDNADDVRTPRNFALTIQILHERRYNWIQQLQHSSTPNRIITKLQTPNRIILNYKPLTDSSQGSYGRWFAASRYCPSKHPTTTASVVTHFAPLHPLL